MTQGASQAKDVAYFIVSYNLRVGTLTWTIVFRKNFGCNYWHMELAEGN